MPAFFFRRNTNLPVSRLEASAMKRTALQINKFIPQKPVRIKALFMNKAQTRYKSLTGG